MRVGKEKQLLKHIIEYCKEIQDAVERIETVDNLLSDRFYQNALSMPLAQIGELSRNFSDEFKELHSDVPWIQMKGLRNHLVHGYLKIDWTEVWDTAVNDIPELKAKCVEIEKEIEK